MKRDPGPLALSGRVVEAAVTKQCLGEWFECIVCDDHEMKESIPWSEGGSRCLDFLHIECETLRSTVSTWMPAADSDQGGKCQVPTILLVNLEAQTLLRAMQG